MAPEYEPTSAADKLAEETGEPVSKFEADDVDIPELDELESVPRDEW